ncbi:MAG: preprotein translocase subunit YajC [Candidatus Omnitrophica bacterium]|nr:preprotein translocase subunit YajC [Candidatus Omnitrophota bacterium]
MGPATQANPIISLLPFILIFAVFYFLLIRPQKQKQVEHQNMVANIKKNDEIITVGGIHGTVVNVKDKTLIIRVDENVKLEVEKTSISVVKKVS